MLNPPDHVEDSIEMGAKDLRLLREAAARQQMRLSLADQMVEIFAQARRIGLPAQDWAVWLYRMAQRRALDR
jgi:3-hydroxyisobutyrate dehydrogenase-like beta-hydroxyacid dehydrogenase